MILESYRYRASADFAWAMKVDYHADRPWVMLHQEHEGGEEYVVADPEGARTVERTHKVIKRWKHEPRETQMIEKHEQVARQCEAVAHLARAIAEVYEQQASLFHGNHAPRITEAVGEETAELMETLGNLLNNMDAVSEDDPDMTPVFEEAQRLWPESHRIR